MKNLPLFTLIFFSSITVVAQDIRIFDLNTKMTWLGIDFSAAKFVGDRELLEKTGLQTFMTDFNQLMIDEEHKFDVATMLHRKTISESLDVVMEHNRQLPTDKMMVEDNASAPKIKYDTLASIISKYDFKGMKGLGVMINIESLNKLEHMAYLWITFVDLDNQKILYLARMWASPFGFGVRNYWAYALYTCMKSVEHDYYNKWHKAAIRASRKK